jgi:hypothetical protein
MWNGIRLQAIGKETAEAEAISAFHERRFPLLFTRPGLLREAESCYNRWQVFWLASGSTLSIRILKSLWIAEIQLLTVARQPVNHTRFPFTSGLYGTNDRSKYGKELSDGKGTQKNVSQKQSGLCFRQSDYKTKSPCNNDNDRYTGAMTKRRIISCG